MQNIRELLITLKHVHKIIHLVKVFLYSNSFYRLSKYAPDFGDDDDNYVQLI